MAAERTGPQLGTYAEAQLWRELLTRGFKGKRGVVYQWLEKPRAPSLQNDNASNAQLPMGRKLARLLLTSRSRQTAAEREFTGKLLKAEPSLGAAAEWVKAMNILLCKKTKARNNVDHLLDIGEKTPLANFAANLRRDLTAIKNALATPWTTSPVEGQISKLKMIKRTMHGRAGFQLLRARILHAH